MPCQTRAQFLGICSTNAAVGNRKLASESTGRIMFSVPMVLRKAASNQERHLRLVREVFVKLDKLAFASSLSFGEAMRLLISQLFFQRLRLPVGYGPLYRQTQPA